jgi:hypothetical protein
VVVMLRWKPNVVPVEIYPADWCIWCDDPGHAKLEECNILTMRQNAAGEVQVGPCGCKDNLVLGEQGDFIVRVTQVQKE